MEKAQLMGQLKLIRSMGTSELKTAASGFINRPNWTPSDVAIIKRIIEDFEQPRRRGLTRVNPKSLKNPRLVKIYGRVERINAQKTQPHICDAGCKKFNHRYFHDFKPGAQMYGLPNGDILITTRKL